MASFLEKYFSASGWGLVKHLNINLSKAEALVSVSNNPFTPYLRGKVTKPIDHLHRGIIAGIFSKAFQKDVDCVEVHCSALGHRECEFVVKQQKNFKLESKNVRRQLEIEV